MRFTLTSGKLDAQIMRLVEPLTGALVRVSGKDNFFWSRAMVVLTVALFSVRMGVVIAEGSQARVILYSGLSAFWLLLVTWHLGHVKDIEEVVRSADEDGLRVTRSQWRSIDLVCHNRVMWAVISVAVLPINLSVDWLFALGESGMIAFALSGYFATDVRPPGKSSWARLRARVRSWKPVPRLAPSPA